MIKLVLISAVFALLLWLCGFGLFIARIHYTHAPEHPEKTDALIILTGGYNRIDKGLDLFAQGLADRLLISGVHKNVTLDNLLEQWGGTLPKKDPQAPKAPKEEVTLGYLAANTMGNAYESTQWIRKYSAQTVRIVTAHYHLPRTRLLFERAMPETAFFWYPVYPARENKDALRYTHLLWSEYNKFLWTWLDVHLPLSMPFVTIRTRQAP